MLWPQDINDFKGRKLEYLHHLQNLYFALTGEELENKSLIMIKHCADTKCGKEFEGRSNQRFCTNKCKERVNGNLANVRRAQRKSGVLPCANMMPWKEVYIKQHHKSKTLEQLAIAIKKPVEVVRKFCADNGLICKPTPVLQTTRPQCASVEPCERPPAVYSNQTREFPYYLARL
jgi:predicted nucleic acid-binding Zn ribbon protein